MNLVPYLAALSALCGLGLAAYFYAMVTKESPGNERMVELMEAIQSILGDAGITTITWDHPPSPPTMSSTPEAQPLIDRLQQLYPEAPDVVDPDGGHAG